MKEKALNSYDAVKQVLDKDSKLAPSQIRDEVLKQFGVVITSSRASTYKVRWKERQIPSNLALKGKKVPADLGKKVPIKVIVPQVRAKAEEKVSLQESREVLHSSYDVVSLKDLREIVAFAKERNMTLPDLATLLASVNELAKKIGGNDKLTEVLAAFA